MTMTMGTAEKTPWHLWAVGGLSLAWNAFGGFDFTMSVMQGAKYWRSMGMTEAYIAYFQALPAWAYGPWAVGVWGSIAGSLLLLLRNRFAFHAFVASLLGLGTTLVNTYLLTDGGKYQGAGGSIMYAVIATVIALLIWYSRAMTRKGVLR